MKKRFYQASPMTMIGIEMQQQILNGGSPATINNVKGNTNFRYGGTDYSGTTIRSRSWYDEDED